MFGDDLEEHNNKHQIYSPARKLEAHCADSLDITQTFRFAGK